MGIFKPARITRKKLLWALFWSVLFATPMIYIFRDSNEPGVSFALNFLLFFFLTIGNGFISDSITISWVEFPVRRFIYTLVFSIIYTLFVAAMVVIVVAYGFYGHTPEYSLRNIDSSYYILVIIITVFLGLFLFGRDFLLNWRQSELRAAKLREAHIAAQYESLQNQVNPHFLFNSLNVLSTLVYRDQDLAAKFIKQLSTVYRYVLDAKNKEAVPLATELTALNAYIFLLKIRFDDGIRFENELPETLAGHIAPLSLQMLVENAVKHNIANSEQPLVISLFEEDGFVVVRNNLQRKNNQQDAMGIGLTNIRTRYQFLSNKAVEVIENATHFKVKLPLILVDERASSQANFPKSESEL